MPSPPTDPARRRQGRLGGLVTGIVLVLAAGLLAGCGSDPKQAGDGCQPALKEALDRQYLVHILPGAPEPEYRTDPPTSGPHQPTPDISGVLDQALTRPVQIGVLEEGKVLLQYRDLPAADRDALEALATDTVVVAPNPDLPEGDRVVATAWITKQRCERFDSRSLREFAATYQGHGPGQP